MLCEVEQSQLLSIDMQERLASAMPEKVMHRVVKNTGILLQAAGELQIPVYRTEQYPAGLGNTLAAVSTHLPDSAHYFEKTCFACSGAEGFSRQMQQSGRQQIILAGIEAHICVLQTALQLQLNGVQVFVVSDAVCSRKKDHYKNALHRLAQAGVVITNTESVLFEWLRDAQHAQFRSLSKLIR